MPPTRASAHWPMHRVCTGNILGGYCTEEKLSAVRARLLVVVRDDAWLIMATTAPAAACACMGWTEPPQPHGIALAEWPATSVHC